MSDIDRTIYFVDALPPCDSGWGFSPRPGYYCDRGSVMRVDGRNFCGVHYPLAGDFEKRRIELKQGNASGL